jgi:hypothetical protein
MATAGLAFAQAKAPAGAGSAAPAKADPKAAAAGSAAPAKAADPKAGAAAAPAAPMEMPKAPAEIAAAAKAMGKTLNCTGTGLGPDMKTEVKMKGTMSAKLDFDGWYIRQMVKMTVGEGKGSSKLNMESLMTLDAKSGKWHVMGVSNDGGMMMGDADMKDGKYEFVGMMSSPMGQAAFKDHGDMTDKKNVKFWGEASMDKGKTWTKFYDVSCK